MANKLAPWVLPELVPVLTGNPRINWVWVWVWGIPDFFSWVWGWLEEKIGRQIRGAP